MVETMMSMLARMALTMAYNVGYLHAAEVYPTAVRSQALSVRQAFGSVGKFFSSQVTQLVRPSFFFPDNITIKIPTAHDKYAKRQVRSKEKQESKSKSLIAKLEIGRLS